MRMTRRERGKWALAGLPVAAGRLFASGAAFAMPQAPRPNSKWADVQVGLNLPYNFGNNNMAGDEVLSRCVQLGISAVELRTQPIEQLLGSPAAAPGAPRAGGRGAQTPEQQAAQRAAAEELR